MFDKTGSQAEATKIKKALKGIQVKLTNVVASACDTTATNSGLNQGVVVKVQKALRQPVFHLACRHHILKLVCGAICKNVFGEKTESSNQPVFKRFADDILTTINQSTYHPF